MTKFDEAVCFAVEKHSGMVRRRESAPYILHPLEVATIVGTISSDEDLLAAAVLHDTVEDADTTLEEIKTRFGERVAALVASETEDKRPELPPEESWKIRKEESLEVLKNATDPAVKVLWLGDKLANIRSFYRSWKISGDEFWTSFHQKNTSEQAWYYRSILTLLEDLKYTDAWQEMAYDVEQIFKGV